MSHHGDTPAQPPLTQELSDIIDKYASPTSSVSSRKPRRKNIGGPAMHRESSASLSSLQSSPSSRGTTSHPSRTRSTDSSYLRRSQIFDQDSPGNTSGRVEMSRALEYFHAPSTPSGGQSMLSERPSSRSLRADTSLGSSSSGLRSLRSIGRHSLAHSASAENDVAGLHESKPASFSFGSGSAVRSKKGLSAGAESRFQGHHNDVSNISQDGARKTSAAQEALRSSLGNNAAPFTPRHARKSSWHSRLFGRFSSKETVRPMSPKSSISDDNISDFEYIEPQVPAESPEVILDRIRARGAALKEQSSKASLSTVSSFLVSDLDDDEHFSPVSSPLRHTAEPQDPAESTELSTVSSFFVSDLDDDEHFLPVSLPSRHTAEPQDPAESVDLSTVSSPVSELDDEEHYLREPSVARQIEMRGLVAAAMGDSVSAGGLTPEDGSLELPIAQDVDVGGVAVEEDGSSLREVGERSGENIGGSTPSDENFRFPTCAAERKGEAAESSGASDGVSTPSDASFQSVPGPTAADEDVSEKHDMAAEHIEDIATPPDAQAADLKLSPITIISRQIPIPPQQNLAFSTWSTIADQEPQTPHAKLAMSPVTPTFVQEPVLPRVAKGLSFVDANAIVYGCMTFAAMLFIVRNIDTDFKCALLAADMGYGLLVALIVCVVLHIELAGKLWACVQGLLGMLGLKRD